MGPAKPAAKFLVGRVMSNIVHNYKSKTRALCLFVSVLSSVPLAKTRICRYMWEVKYEYQFPDCYKKLVIAINGRTPGPSIIEQQNDTIVVHGANQQFVNSECRDPLARNQTGRNRMSDSNVLFCQETPSHTSLLLIGLGHACTIHIMVCREKPGINPRMENPSPFHMTMIEASYSYGS
ncbi:uncharacterized protein LOC132314830 [Cornus florida]|uniref:uncharacterized protein LOC132314830 n=1 Tax=Cornus florida TaxID=4283 RepID=UPI00289682AB|nr:uncharacterized protein LOC132314830 [Cornus florida]